jgi:hypothetical protein
VPGGAVRMCGVFEVAYIATADWSPPRRLLLAVGDDLSQWPEARPVEVEEPFVVLTAFDASGIPDETLSTFARRLLEQGCLYACAWGERSLFVEQHFDDVEIEAEARGEPFDPEGITTTWHGDESLREALLFAVHMASHPHQDIKSVLVVTTPDHAEEIAALLAEPEALWGEDDEEEGDSRLRRALRRVFGAGDL